MVFLDTVGLVGNMDFKFFPVRKVKIMRLHREASAIYVDFTFDDEAREVEWDTFFRNLANRPWPPPQRSGRGKEEHGSFILSNERCNPEFPTEGSISNEPWKSVIERLDKTEGLKASTFFQVLGFYEIKRAWLIPKVNLRLPLIGPLSEIPVRCKGKLHDSIYPLPMGKSIVLRLLFERPSYDYESEASRRVLELKYSNESLAGVSKSIIHSDSRYNEERIILVCKRVPDPIVSSISIEQQNDNSIQSPKPFLLTQISVPRGIIGVVVVSFFISTLLVSLGPDSIERLGAWIWPAQAPFIKEISGFFSGFAKLLAAALVGVSGYLAFRRLPLK